MRAKTGLLAIVLGLGAAAPLPIRADEVRAAYKKFDRSVERYIKINERLMIAEERLQSAPPGRKPEMAAEVRRFRAELKRARVETLRTASVYLGDETDRISRLAGIADLADELLIEAEKFAMRGLRKDALYAIGKSIALAPKNPEAYIIKAGILNDMGLHRSAAEAAHTALELDPDNPRAYKKLAVSQLKAGRVKDALDSVVRAYTGKGLFGSSAEDNWKLPEDQPGEPARRGRSPLPFLAAGLGLGIVGYLFASFLVRKRGVAAKPEAETEKGSAAMGVEVPKADLLAGKYELDAIVDYGTSSQLWSAKDHSLKRSVVVQKVLLEGEAVRKAFVENARKIAGIQHQNIVDIYDVIDGPEGLFLMREVLTGKSAEELVAGIGPLPLVESVRILGFVCEALEAAHAQGLFHRSLNPANIQVTESGHVKVFDFGLSRILNEFEAIAFVPPEAGQEKPSASYDVYSLGTTAYRMLTGRNPEEGMEFDGVSPAAESLIKEAVDTDPGRRVQTASEFSKRLQSLL